MPKGLHLARIAVYLRDMTQPRKEGQPARSALRARDLLEFRPWMLALAVFLACAIGIAIMEQVRDARTMWAQVTPQDGAAQGR
jgi:hypothetical protein